jgi:hypothetical protein
VGTHHRHHLDGLRPDVSDFRRSSVWSDRTATYRSAKRGNGYHASVTGCIRAMGFTDDDETSNGGVAQ